MKFGNLFTKGKLISLIIIVVIVLLLFALFTRKTLDAKLLTINNDIVKVYDFSKGEVLTIDIEKYCQETGESFLVTDQNDIVRITSVGKELLYSMDARIISNIIEYGDELYFVAEENSSDMLSKRYLYSLKNNNLKKIYENEVSLRLLQYDDTILFADWKNNEIMAYYPGTESIGKICDGNYPCWKEYGKSLFLNLDTEAGHQLGILDIKSGEITKLDVDVHRPLAYNTEHNILLYMGVDDVTSYGDPEGIARILNLNTMETTYTFRYQNLIQQINNNAFFSISGGKWQYN